MYSSSYFNLGSRCVWVVNDSPRSLYPRKRQVTHFVRGWMGHRVSPDGCAEASRRRRRYSIPEPSSPYRVATPTELSRFDCTQHCYIMDTFPSPSHSTNYTEQIQSSWRRRQHASPKQQSKLFIKSNIWTRRDLDPCCAFVCSQVQIFTPKRALLN